MNHKKIIHMDKDYILLNNITTSILGKVEYIDKRMNIVRLSKIVIIDEKNKNISYNNNITEYSLEYFEIKYLDIYEYINIITNRLNRF